MNCKNCSALRWHPTKGFYCTVPDCNPDTTVDDVNEIYRRAYDVSRNVNQLAFNRNRSLLFMLDAGVITKDEYEFLRSKRGDNE